MLRNCKDNAHLAQKYRFLYNKDRNNEDAMKEKSRLTLDMSHDEHVYLKMACAKLGVTMREFLLHSAFEKMQEVEDEWLAEKARETLENIHSGKEKTIPWDEMKKRIA
jgi:hypothetical protein